MDMLMCYTYVRYCIICFCITVCLLINPFSAYESYVTHFTYA